jgi:hypothetical protein
MRQLVRLALAFTLLAVVSIVASCGGGRTSSTPTVLTSQSVGPAGATVTVTDPASALFGTTVVIPAGALGGNTTITIQQAAATGLPSGVIVVELGPSGTVFAVPVTVTVSYSPQYLAANGLSAADLTIVVMNPGVADQPLRTVAVDTTNHTISAQTTHFSNFAALGFSNATLSGPYGVSDYYVESATSNPMSVVALSVPSTPFTTNLSVPIGKKGHVVEVGTVVFDGMGGYSYSATKNKDGVVTSVSSNGAYSVSANGKLTLDGAQGQVMAGGGTFTMGSAAGDPQIGFGIRKSGTFTTASLSGTFALRDFYVESSSSNPMSVVALSVPSTPFSTNLGISIVQGAHAVEVADVTFDGAGGFSFSGIKNKDGVVTPVSGSGSYSVSTDGKLALQGLTGQVATGGATFIVASASGDPQIGIGIRKSGSFSAASLSGSYTLTDMYVGSTSSNPMSIVPLSVPSTPFTTNLSFPIAKAGYTVETGTVTFDGAGGYSFSATKNKDGVVSPVSGSGPYTVTPDGKLSLAGLSGQIMTGGGMFTVGSPSGDPQIGIGILR